jgi:RNA polymerase sigma-70 factor (ECF subfamily)
MFFSIPGNKSQKAVSNGSVGTRFPAGKHKVSPMENGRVHEMVFTKSIALDEEDIGSVAVAAEVSTAFPDAETEFVDRLKAGDASAFDLLINRYSADIYALLFRLTEDADEAGDLLQETFLSALKAIRNFRGDSELKTWLFRIAINHSRNRFRWWKRRKRSKTVSLDATVGNTEMRLADTIEADTVNPENAALAREREQMLRQALIDIPDIFREAIVLCDIDGHRYQEIAKILNVSLGTVKSRIARGREELRSRLKDF